ncbi:MAG: helicase RepA family protein [Clostridiales bacterium]|nr:helicase RepA family protein [Clostridiales bacterium]
MKDEFGSLPQAEQEAVMQTIKEMEELSASPPRFDPNVDLHTVTMSELYDTTFPPRTPLVDGLIYSGTYLFAGSPKIGKSFFMMQLAYHVAMGISLWNYPVRQGTVLYLALEDDYARLQSRLMQMFGVEATDHLILTTQSRTLEEGLTEQMERFMQRHPYTSLVIVDTLQRVREIGTETYSYAMDYKNIAAMKEFTDRHNICLLIVHHTRKMEASDSFETISGTTGLLGAADGAIVLQKKKRIEDTATMQIVGRDQEDQELTLEFDRERCFWQLSNVEKTIFSRKADPLLYSIAGFMVDKSEWTGTATELVELLDCADLKPHVLTRKMNAGVSDLYNKFGVSYTQNERSRDKRTFTLRNRKEVVDIDAIRQEKGGASPS